ncbi:hypothetical protein FT173_009250 [Bordetella pertussis]
MSQLENFFPPFLGTLLPVLEGIGECMGVVRDSAHPLVILFSVPGDTDAANSIHGQSSLGNGWYVGFRSYPIGAAVSMEISTPDPDFKTFYLALP